MLTPMQAAWDLCHSECQRRRSPGVTHGLEECGEMGRKGRQIYLKVQAPSSASALEDSPPGRSWHKSLRDPRTRRMPLRACRKAGLGEVPEVVHAAAPQSLVFLKRMATKFNSDLVISTRVLGFLCVLSQAGVGRVAAASQGYKYSAASMVWHLGPGASHASEAAKGLTIESSLCACS